MLRNICVRLLFCHITPFSIQLSRYIAAQGWREILLILNHCSFVYRCCRFSSASTFRPLSLRRRHAVKGAMACAPRAAVVCMDFLSCVYALSYLPFSPKRLLVSARSPDFGILSQSQLMAVLPHTGVALSDGHSVFKVRLIDELP